MYKRVEIVGYIYRVPCFFKKWKTVYLAFGDELVIELKPPANNDDSAVGQDLVGSVPSWYIEAILVFFPVAVSAGLEAPHDSFSNTIPAGLNELAVGGQLTGGAPCIGGNSERPEVPVSWVEFYRVSVTDLIFGAPFLWKSEVGRTGVGSVEDDDFVVR